MLRVFPAETEESRVRRALETFFQVRFFDHELEFKTTGNSRGQIFYSLYRPFIADLEMMRMVTQTQSVYETHEDFQLKSYDKRGWRMYLAVAADTLGFNTVYDLLRSCVSRDAVMDVLAALLLTDRVPFDFFTTNKDAVQRNARRVRINARSSRDASDHDSPGSDGGAEG